MHGRGMSMERIAIVLAGWRKYLGLHGRSRSRERIASRVSQVGIRQASRRAGQANSAGPRSVTGLILLVSRRHGVVEKSVARANGLPAVTHWVPRQSDARLEQPGPAESIAAGHSGIAGEKQARRSVDILAGFLACSERREIEVLHPVEFFALGEVWFPAHTELESQTLAEANHIVGISADGVLPAVKRLHTPLLKVAGHPQQEVSQRVARGSPVEGERAIRHHIVSVIEQIANPVHADREMVPASDHVQVVR